ncbi:transposase IS3/IS911 family protein [Rhodovulum sulfidophilum]|uniref:Transposase IS3/IS911 family protein n=1 Tax=Rhodovulum sulfidophilum TaxID=35806 RepID=A0A0D6B6X4_RHOSU|nr:transposase IS3/IS911 family protein [Rhodovulum sulfidophilum]
MKRTSVTDEQIIGIQAEHEAGAKCPDLYREHRMPEGTVYNWKASFGGMTVSEAKRPKALEDQNAKLKKRPAGQMLDLAAIKDLITKNGTVRREARSGRIVLASHGLSARRACRIVDADRKMGRNQAQRAPDTAPRG